MAGGSFFGNPGFHPSSLEQPSYDVFSNCPFPYEEPDLVMKEGNLSSSADPFMLPSPLEQPLVDFPRNQFDLSSPFSDEGAHISAIGNPSDFSWNMNDFPMPPGDQQGRRWDSPMSPTEDSNSPAPKPEVLKPENIRRNSTRSKLSRPTPPSPSSSANSPTFPNEPPPRRRRSKKPKSPVVHTRMSHNAIEKKYRQNLNTQIEALWTTISTLPAAKDIAGDLLTDYEDPSKQPSKATIISSARTLLIRLEKYNALAEQEVKKLRERTLAYQQLLSSRSYPKAARANT